MKTYCYACGERVFKTKKPFSVKCSKCNNIVCGKCYMFHVDGNNRAITKSLYSLGVCKKCLGKVA